MNHVIKHSTATGEALSEAFSRERREARAILIDAAMSACRRWSLPNMREKRIDYMKHILGVTPWSEALEISGKMTEVLDFVISEAERRKSEGETKPKPKPAPAPTPRPDPDRFPLPAAASKDGDTPLQASQRAIHQPAPVGKTRREKIDDSIMRAAKSEVLAMIRTTGRKTLGDLTAAEGLEWAKKLREKSSRISGDALFVERICKEYIDKPLPLNNYLDRSDDERLRREWQQARHEMLVSYAA